MKGAARRYTVFLALVVELRRRCNGAFTPHVRTANPTARRLVGAAGKNMKHALSSTASTTSSTPNQPDEGGVDADLASILTGRLPTSVEDQVRQAAESIRRASQGGCHRHVVRLLLPVQRSSDADLDDWPGGARQMMEAADPLVDQILKQATPGGDTSCALRKVIIDPSDGVGAVFAQAESAKDDSCTVLLPAAETVPKLQELEAQVGPTRNLIVVNPQWKRRSDFGGFGTFFGQQAGQRDADFVERFEPTFSLTNMICECESIRILRTYPGMWRVYLRQFNDDDGSVDWMCVGSQAVLDRKPTDWEKRPGNQQDGGKLFDFGQPTYQDVLAMLQSSPAYKAKNPAERAAAAFEFIKDSCRHGRSRSFDVRRVKSRYPHLVPIHIAYTLCIISKT
jgi:Domain of unknown function (DUF1995)